MSVHSEVPGLVPAPATPSRKGPLLGVVLGALAHTAVCWLVLQLDFFRGGLEPFNILFGILWTGYAGFALVFLLGLNQRFSDPHLTFPIMLWSTGGLLASAWFVDQVRLCVMLMFYAILQPGVFRLHFRDFVVVSALCVAGYGLVIHGVARTWPEALDLTGELIQWGAFTLITGGVVAVAGEIAGLRRQLDQSNARLDDIVRRRHEQAIHDELTGLYNRRHAVERLAKLRQIASRTDTALVVAYLDLDHFKHINDRHGHQAGDEVLAGFAALLRERLGENDFAARLGGEEFLLVMAETDPVAAGARVEALRRDTEILRFPSLPAGFHVTVSIGLAAWQRPETVDELLARADRALYDAKHGGRNRVCLAEAVA